MFFLARHTSADLSLVTPPDFCCNCGERGPIEFVATPLKKIRYFFVVGTELTLNEYFLYCRTCKKTAARIRQGWMSKLLATCLMTSVVFLVLVFIPQFLPGLLRDNLFRSSVLIAALLTAAYFYCQEWSRKGRSYYQPVSLVDADLQGERLGSFTLKFHNPRYAALLRQTNRDLVKAGMLKIQ